MRPFLYPTLFPWQFNKIDELASSLPDRSKNSVGEGESKQGDLD
jgi:NAD+ synthase (glutamine-hydrolysing)